MARYSFTIEVAAPRELLFDLWTDIHRIPAWTHGATGVAEVKGAPGEPGTRYRVWYGSLDERVEVLAATRPYVVRTRTSFGGIRAEAQATFEAIDGGTRMRLAWTVRGLKSRAWGRLLAIGAYRWTFRRELDRFAQVAEREVHQTVPDRVPVPVMVDDRPPSPVPPREESVVGG